MQIDKYLTNYGEDIKALALDLSLTTNPWPSYSHLYDDNVFRIKPKDAFDYAKDSIELKMDLIKYFNYSFLTHSNIMFVSGIDNSYEVIAFRFLSTGSRTACIVPCFSRFEIVIRHFNLGDVIHVKDIMDLDLGMDIDIVYLCTPNNPTTEEYDMNLLEAALTILPESMFIIDGTFVEFGKADPTRLLTKYQNLILLRSFSKIFGLPGIRLGYIIAAENIIQRISNNLSPFRVSAISYKIARSILKFPTLIQQSLKYLSSEWNYIRNSCPLVVARKSNVPFYLLYPPVDATLFVNILINYNISIVNGKYFAGINENVVRISICSPEKNRGFIRAINCISNRKKWISQIRLKY